MFYQIEGYPEEDEIVLCKVTKIFPNSVFVELLEYHRQGMVHISEVSPGRIRNLRDFVSLDRQIVCKILSINKEKGYIDLTLRRVNSNQRREKLDEIKSELKAENLVANIARKLKLPPEQLYQQVSSSIFKEYSHLYLCFRDVAAGQVTSDKLGLKTEWAKEIDEAVIEKFRPKKVTIKGEIRLKTYHSNGLEKVKNLLASIKSLSENIILSYLGAGRFKVVIEDYDYKPAEQTLKKIQEILDHFLDKISEASFERDKHE